MQISIALLMRYQTAASKYLYHDVMVKSASPRGPPVTTKKENVAAKRKISEPKQRHHEEQVS